jgi:hypothetical protein
MMTQEFFQGRDCSLLQDALFEALPIQVSKAARIRYLMSESFVKSAMVCLLWLIRYSNTSRAKGLTENCSHRQREEDAISFPVGFSLRNTSSRHLQSIEGASGDCAEVLQEHDIRSEESEISSQVVSGDDSEALSSSEIVVEEQ